MPLGVVAGVVDKDGVRPELSGTSALLQVRVGTGGDW